MSWTTRYKASITNQNQGGGNAKEGLPPSVGKGNLSVWNGMGRAYGTPEDRALQVCINQLGSVNPRVYQSRYCGKVSNNRNTRDCDPQFTIESNQWLRQQDTDVGRYDISFVLDKSGSMREDADGAFPPPQGEPSKWNLLTRFMRIFHNLVLNQSLQNGGDELQGDENLHAPAKIPTDDNGFVDPQNCNYADPSYRLSFLTFSNNSELNLTYNTYVSQIFQPQEAGQTPDVNSEIPQDKKEFPITEGRFNQLLDAFGIPAGGTNGAEAVNGLTELHKTHQFFNGTSYVGPQGNFVPASTAPNGNETPASGDPNSRCGNYIQRYNNTLIIPQVCGSDVNTPLSCSNQNGEMPGDKETNLVGDLPRNIAIPAPAAFDYPNNFNSGDPTSNIPIGNYELAKVPNGEPNAGQLSLPPYRYPITGTQHIGYRNGWRNLNTILIWVTDGAINTGNDGIVNFTNEIATLNTFEQNLQLQCNSIFGNCLTRIAIGFGNGAVVDELEAFAGITNQDYTGIVANGDEYHRVINQADLSVQAMTNLAEDVLSSVTNISFTQTTSPEYSILSLNRGTSCPYTDTQFINEIIPLIQDLIDNGGKLSTLDLTGQILLTNVTLEALIVIPDFLANIKTLILSGCSDMTDNAITSLITILNGGDGNPQNGLVNLDLSFTGITSAGISTLVTDGNVPGVQSSQTLKYFNIDGIPFPNTNTNPANLNIVMSGLSQNTSLECLSMRLCQLDNNMIDDEDNLKKLIETPSQSNLIHIHLDQNNMNCIEIKAFVTSTDPIGNQLPNGFDPANKIDSLTRVFMQFQITAITTPLQPPTTPPINVWVTEGLLQVNDNNAVIIGQYLTSEVQAINGVTSLINGVGIPVFVANGYTQANIYQAWVEIPLGSGQFRVGGTYQTPAPTDPWYEPGIFNHNNPNVVLGKVLY